MAEMNDEEIVKKMSEPFTGTNNEFTRYENSEGKIGGYIKGKYNLDERLNE